MIWILSLLLFLSSFFGVYGTNEFTTNQQINYYFNNSGQASIEHKINIINNYSQFYPKEYSLSLSGISPQNIRSFDNNGSITNEINTNNNQTNIKLFLPNAQVGKNQITSFTLNYQNQNSATKKGNTWEIILPQFQDSLSSDINLDIKVPQSFGKLSSSPDGATISLDSQNTNINFLHYNPKSKLVLTFGEYQLFNFNLKYQIQNNTDTEGYYSIPIPPDTGSQKIYYQNFDPQPTTIRTDPDGNWLADFLLKPQTKLTIGVQGQAKIGLNPEYHSTTPPLYDNQLYWPSDNPEIVSLAKNYSTPRQIYNFVTSTLNYDYTRINNSTRRGAIEALKNPDSSLCTDFTDLFISIARAAKIGAREIEGYAYSNNTSIKPLSLGTDILHAWPEYYNSKTMSWVAIDPTWGKTTGGIDYFDDLDLNHFAFVIHNQKSDSPSPPGSYKSDPNTKSVDISFADAEINPQFIKPEISIKFNPFSGSKIVIYNPNLFALDNFSLNDSPPQSIMPISTIYLNFPWQPISTLLISNQNVSLSYSYNHHSPEAITLQNPFHFFYLLISIISGLILLSLSAIILLRHH